MLLSNSTFLPLGGNARFSEAGDEIESKAMDGEEP